MTATPTTLRGWPVSAGCNRGPEGVHVKSAGGGVPMRYRLQFWFKPVDGEWSLVQRPISHEQYVDLIKAPDHVVQYLPSPGLVERAMVEEREDERQEVEKE